MRRGAPDNPWSNPRPENWVSHGQRFPRVNPRPNFHGYNQRGSGPRHWRPEGGFRPRNPGWNGNNFKPPLLRLPNNDGHSTSRPGSSNRFPWPDSNQHNLPPLMHNAPPPPQFSQRETYGLKGEQNLHETINTVKQKLRERTMSSDFTPEPVHDTQIEDTSGSGSNYKPGERRRIEHSKPSNKRTTAKKTGKRGDGFANRPKNNNQSHSLSDICKRKAELMRRKILKQLFKLDKDKLRNLLNQSEKSAKYEIALNSLFKETRDAISRDIRNAAEKSLQDNTKKIDTEKEKVVQDEFLGHLGTMLDKDATLELSSMEPQIIAQLSKVLQEDLMGPLTDEMSVRSLANAMSDSVRDDFYNDYPFQGQDPNNFHIGFQHNSPHNSFGNPFNNYHNTEDNMKHERGDYYDTQYFEGYNNEQFSDFKYNPENSSHNNQQFHVRDDYYLYHHPLDKMKSNSEFSQMTSNSLLQGPRNDYGHPDEFQYSVTNTPNQIPSKSTRDSPDSCKELDSPLTEDTRVKLSPRGVCTSVTDNMENSNDTSKTTDNVSKRKKSVDTIKKNDGVSKISDGTGKRSDSTSEVSNVYQETEPISPPRDEDFRLMLPKNINLSDKTAFMMNVKEGVESAVKEEESKDVTSEKEVFSGASNVHQANKRKCEIVSEFEHSHKKCNVMDSNIAIRKDLFPVETDNKTSQSPPAKVEDTTVDMQQKFATVSTQTDASTNTRAQGVQHYTKKSDASSQVYESLFASKSKGTQTLGENMKDRSCQTLKINGLSSITLSNNTERLLSVETQTDECEKKETKDAESSCDLIDESKIIKNTHITSIVKSENVLERMKEIDNQILELMKEKLSLYNSIKLGDVETVKRSESVNTYHIPIVRNKSRSGSETPRRSDKHSSSTKFTEYIAKRQSKDRERSHTKERADTRIGKPASNTSNTSGKQKPSVVPVDSDKLHRNSTRLLPSRHKVKEDDHLKHDRHKVPNKRSKPFTVSENSKTLPYNVVPGKDISNCSVKPEDALNISTEEEQSTELSNIDNNVESRYIDPSGYPVPMDCEVVVSEEVVINSESDNNTILSEDSKLTAVENRRKRSDTKRNRNSSNNSSNNKNVKSDCDMVVVRNNTKLPHGGKTVPPIKIKKRSSLSVSEPQAKSSPLYNLISQMKDSDEDVDTDIVKPSFNHKETSISDTLADNVDANHNLSLIENMSSQSNNVKILDCIVQLERLDVTKIPNDLKISSNLNCLSGYNNPSMSFVEEIDPAILNDDALFSSKNYENDEDCILQSEQFGSFCDTDPGIIENIEVDEAFNIIDQWDSKLFENVSLLEDREILQDKNLLESIESEEVTLKEPLYYSSHNDPITALQYVGNNFLAACQDGCVYYYDGTCSKLIRIIRVCSAAITCMSLKAESPHVYIGSRDGILRCYNYETGRKVMEDVQTACGPIQCMYQEWKTIYLGTQTGFVVQFDVVASTMLSDSIIKFSENTILALHAMKEGPRKVILIASRFQEVAVKDAATGLLLRSFHGHNNAVYSLLFDSGKVYCGTSGPDVQIFDFVTGDIVGVLTGGRGAVCLQMYRGLIFTGCYDGFIYVYSKASEEKPVAKIRGPGKMLLAMSVVKNKIIAGCNDKKLSVIPLPAEVIQLLE